MSSPEIQWKQLGQLKIPGTYNRTAYKFDRIISPMLEKGVDKLVNPRIVGQAPSDHRLDDTNNIFIGQQAYDDLIDHITLLSQAHDESKTLKSSSKMVSVSLIYASTEMTKMAITTINISFVDPNWTSSLIKSDSSLRSRIPLESSSS
jgi:hypothetical protein